MGSSTPLWASAARGTPIECVAVLCASKHIHDKLDLQFQSRNVALLRPGQAQASREDIYQGFSFCYDSASNAAIFSRTVDPYIEQALEGFNVNLCVLGATGTGADLVLDGMPGATNEHPQAQGMVRLAVQALFDKLHKRSLETGRKVAAKIRSVTSKSFDFQIEVQACTSVEEIISDRLKHTSVNLVEDPLDGWTLQGAQRRFINSAEDANEFLASKAGTRPQHGCLADTVGEHTTTVVIVTIWQYWPGTGDRQEDVVVRSQIRFIQTPGTERLATEPAILRIREAASLNHSLLSFVSTLKELQSQKAMAQVDTSKSNLTKLMCNSLGGNASTLFLGTFKQGQLSESEALLKFLQLATMVETFPIRNESRARGLLHVYFSTILQLKNERNALEQQVDKGGAQLSGVSASKVSRMMEQNLQLKEEVAAMLQEKADLQQKLETLQKADVHANREFQRLLDSIVESEEQRLAVGRALLDTQLEHNASQQDFAKTKFALEQRILELEGEHAQELLYMEEGAAANARCNKAEREREKMVAVHGIAQTHIQQLVSQIVTIEQAKHQFEQESQEETLQLRQRILSESQIRQKAELDRSDLAQKLHECRQQLERTETAKTELTHQVQDLQRLVETSASAAQRNVLKMKDGEIQEIQSKASILQTEVHALREECSRHGKVQGHLHAMLTAYRNLRVTIEGAARGADKMPELVEHEDVILGKASDSMLQSYTLEGVRTGGHRVAQHDSAGGLHGAPLQIVRKLKQAEARAVLAEEQLKSLTAYMNTATIAYQKEIARLTQR
eukprot:jgi/Ulvmu1/4380/UM002_0105.1